MNKIKATLLYDSECTFCVRFKKGLEYIDHEKKILARSIHDSSVYIDFPELTKEECEEVIHLIDESGKIYKGSEVIAFLIGILPGVSKISWLLESDSAKSAMKAFYGQINNMRVLKKKNCRNCGKSKKTKRSL